MKNARIIMAMLVLLGAASMAEAQIVVSSTTASTTREVTRSGREGWAIRPAVEIGLPSFGISGTVCYHFNPYFSIGGGLGCFVVYDNSSRPSSLPIFANARVYFMDRKWSPFLDLMFGYMIPLKSVEYVDTYGTMTLSYHGLCLGSTLGVQVKGFDFGIDVKWRRFGDYLNLNGYLGVSVAYNFQFKKK